nr:MAG TPA: hypothetical protein [Caudoviricetes sp.]
MSLKSMNEAFEHAYGKLTENGDFTNSINEADVIIPKDKMFDPDYISLTGIARQAKEAEDARIAKEAEDKRRAEAEIHLKPMLDELSKADDKLELLFDKLVPNSGKADSVAGEMVRAMMRILYRDYNDGDVFYEGYGLETCGSSAEFLMGSDADLTDDFKAIVEDQLADEAYTEAITAISNKLVEFIINNPYLIVEDNNIDSRNYGIDWLEENQPKYDYSCTLPEVVVDHIDNGDISNNDVQWELESWEIPGLGSIEKNCDSLYVYRDTVEISGLTKDAYDWVDEHLYKELESYANTLDEEYGSTDPYDNGEEFDDDIDECMESIDEDTAWDKIKHVFD